MKLRSEMLGSKRTFKSFVYGSLLKPEVKRHNAQTANVILKLHTSKHTHAKWVRSPKGVRGEEQKILLERNLPFQIKNMKIIRDAKGKRCIELDMYHS